MYYSKKLSFACTLPLIFILLATPVFAIENITGRYESNKAHQHAHTEETFPTVAERINLIRQSTDFVQNVIVGIPIEKVQGATDRLSFTRECCEVLFTDYYFRVINWAFGIPGEEIIRVRSQVGNVFEIGNEYTFAAIRINSVFFDQYNVNSNGWILSNEEASEAELENLLSSVGNILITPFVQPYIIETAMPTEGFIGGVDIAVIATVMETYRRDIDNDNFSALLELNEVVKGEIGENYFDEWVRLRGDVAVGGVYLIFFHSDEYGNLTLAARDGAIVRVDSIQFNSFMDVLE